MTSSLKKRKEEIMFVNIGFDLPILIVVSLVLSLASFFLIRFLSDPELPIYFVIPPVLSLIICVLGIVREFLPYTIPVDFLSTISFFLVAFAIATTIAIDILCIWLVTPDPKKKSKHKTNN